jgi:hypothetical protein
MEIHKPKPTQSWRDFLSEIGVVVLGILIALSGEQLIEMLHWHHQVKDTETSLTHELASNIEDSVARMRTMGCLERRLDEISSLIDTAAKDHVLPPLGTIGRPSIYEWPNGAWASAVASQTTARFGAQRLNEFTSTYEYVNRSAETNQRELEAWAELSMIVGPGRAFDSSSEAAARLALSHARFLGREMGLLSLRVLQSVKVLNLRLDTADGAKVESAIHDPLDSTLCRPMGASISSRYGQVPWDEIPPMLDKELADIEHLYK